MAFDTPQSRNEAIIQNMLGASNQLEDPQSRIEALLHALLEKISTLDKMANYIGVTTTELTDGSTTNPIMINGESVTAVTGDMVFYSSNAYTWNGSIWQQTISFAEIITDVEELQALFQELGISVSGGKVSLYKGGN